MTPNTVLVAQLVPDTEQDTEIDLLHDRDWVAAEFAAIMTTSGFGDRVIVTTLEPRPVHKSERTARGGRVRGRGPVMSRPARGARVRSPPVE